MGHIMGGDVTTDQPGYSGFYSGINSDEAHVFCRFDNTRVGHYNFDAVFYRTDPLLYHQFGIFSARKLIFTL